jgi:hypothetical protein
MQLKLYLYIVLLVCRETAERRTSNVNMFESSNLYSYMDHKAGNVALQLVVRDHT